MLNRDMFIKGAMVGLDPDKEEKPQLVKWLKAHPIISEKFKTSHANCLSKKGAYKGKISKKSVPGRDNLKVKKN